MSGQGNFGSGRFESGGLQGVVRTVREKARRSSSAVPLLLVGSVAAVVLTAGAVSLYNAMQDDERTTGSTSGYGGGHYIGGGHAFGSGGSSAGYAAGGTSRGGFGGTGHSGGGS